MLNLFIHLRQLHFQRQLRSSGAALFALVVGSPKTVSSTTGLFIFADDIKISVPVKENQNNVIDNIFTWSSSVN